MKKEEGTHRATPILIEKKKRETHTYKDRKKTEAKRVNDKQPKERECGR